VNTDYEYQRRTDRTVDEIQSGEGPSQHTQSARVDRSIMWVRPSELATTVTSPALRRSADLQAEIARRGRRAPARARRARQRITRSAIGRTQPPAPTNEGLGL